MCYIKAPGVEDGKSAVRPLSPEGMATACGDQAGPQLSAIGPQLTIVASPRPDGVIRFCEDFPSRVDHYTVRLFTRRYNRGQARIRLAHEMLHVL
jgi:hypothetical protein